MPTYTVEEREERLDRVLASYLQALKEGGAPGRQELLDSHPELAGDLAAFFADQDRFDRFAAPLRTLLPTTERMARPRDFGDYEIHEELARGGMGVVYKARQKSLGRVVALKMLLAGPWASAADLQRFRTEAEAAAQLDHPNIVPIHDVGTHEGHPYLCLKLVEGGSLAQHLSAERRPWSREAASLLADVADAIHYAHQHGILHRDLKPANILLQKRRTAKPTKDTKKDSNLSSRSCDPWSNVFPLVTDFGLAKRVPRTGRTPSGSSWNDASGVPTLPWPRQATHTGAILGTPGYMAPEQASGSPAAVTTAADVYGLGAILYEMLTGRPPFKASTLLDTVRQVLEQEPTRPSLHEASIDRDLETICLKCLQKEPGKRYAGAGELADDLRRFLRGQPILARPVGPVERAWRWARRQPVIAALMFTLAVVFIAGLSSVLALWRLSERSREEVVQHARMVEQQRDELEHARQETEANRIEKERHLQDAENSFRMAHQAVHDYCQRVSENIQGTPALQPLRKELLEHALKYYKDFLSRRDQDPALRRELADTYAQSARLTLDFGSRGDARTAAEQAVAMYRELQSAEPDDGELQCKLAESLNLRSILEDSSESALVSWREAREVYLRFLDQRPREIRLRAGLAIVLSNMGEAYRRMGRRAEAHDCFQQGRDLLEQLVKDYPRHAGVHADLASLLSNYGLWCNQDPQTRPEGLQHIRRELELRAELAQARPSDTKRQTDLAAAHQHLGIVLRESGQFPEALQEFQKSHDIRARLARNHPRIGHFQADLASSLTDLGNHFHRQNQLEQALNYFRQARDIQEKLYRQDPQSPYLRRDLARGCFRVSLILGDLKLYPEEQQMLIRAREMQEALVQIDPNNLDDRHYLSQTLDKLGWNRLEMNHPDETPPLIREALEHMRPALDRAPAVTRYRETASLCWRAMAEAEKRLDHTRAAADALRQAAQLLPDDADALFRISRLLAIVARRVGGGKHELPPGLESERRRDLDDAFHLLRQAAAKGYRDAVRLQNDKAFDLLRPRDDFRALVRKLEKQARVDKKAIPMPTAKQGTAENRKKDDTNKKIEKEIAK